MCILTVPNVISTGKYCTRTLYALCTYISLFSCVPKLHGSLWAGDRELRAVVCPVKTDIAGHAPLPFTGRRRLQKRLALVLTKLRDAYAHA
jgi:hypothetical protein